MKSYVNLYRRLRRKSGTRSEPGTSPASAGVPTKETSNNHTSSPAPDSYASVSYARPDPDVFAQPTAPDRAQAPSVQSRYANSTTSFANASSKNTSYGSTRSNKRTYFALPRNSHHSPQQRRTRWSRSRKNKKPYRYIARPGITDGPAPVFPTTLKGWVKHVATHLRRAAKFQASRARYHWENFIYWIKRKLRLDRFQGKIKTAIMDLTERVMWKLQKYSTAAVEPKEKGRCQESCGCSAGRIQKKMRRYSDSAGWAWKKVKTLSPKQARNIEEFRRASELSERLWNESHQD